MPKNTNSEIRSGQANAKGSSSKGNWRAKSAKSSAGSMLTAKSGRFMDGARHVAIRDRKGLIKLADR
ncbi:hypothetical protein N9M66_02670 [Litoreibacter sp.]|nr:hypothetical protein [Litoreibacter sp.]